MLTSNEFLIPAAGIISIQLAVIILLYNIIHIRRTASSGGVSSLLGTFVSKGMTLLLPIAIAITAIGNAAAFNAYRDHHRKQAEKEARAVEYGPILSAALRAKPDRLCYSNGYLVEGEVDTAFKRPCAQVGRFRVLSQYLGMSTLLEIYKVSDDGTVRPAAYQKDYEIGFVADTAVTTIDELRSAFVPN